MKYSRKLLLLGLILGSSFLSGCFSNTSKDVNNGLLEEMESSISQVKNDDLLIGGKWKISEFYSRTEDQKVARELIGSTYKDIKMETASGKRVNLYDLEGPIVLAYSSGGCSACVASLEPMKEFKDLNPSYNVVTLVSDDSDIHVDNLKGRDNDMFFRISTEEKNLTFEKFSGYGYPFYIYIDENREIKLVTLGSVSLESIAEYTSIAFD